MNGKTALILGGTGVISRAVVTELINRGVGVTVVNRGTNRDVVPREAELIVCDRHDVDGLERQLKGRSFTYVIDVICFSPADARATMGLFRDRCDHVLVLSSVAAYERPYTSIPTREEAETYCTDRDYTYGFEKGEMERTFQEYRGTHPPVTIVRPSLTFGPGARNVGVLRQNMNIVNRLKRGRPLVLFGDGTGLWSFSFADDVARGMVELLGNPAAFGEDFHIATEEPTLWRDLYRTFGEIVGREPEFTYIPAAVLFGASPERGGHLFFEKRYPGLFDGTKFRRAVPGFTFRRTLRDGLEEVLESWKRDGLEPDSRLDALEDRLCHEYETFARAVSDAFARP